MKKIILLLLIFSFITLEYAQQVGNWKNYSDMKNISATLYKNNLIWAATSGGGFLFNPSDSTYQQFTQSEGFTNQILLSIAQDDNGKVWFGAANGAIDIFSPEDGSLNSILDIVNSNKTIKRINEIYTKNQTAYISTAFGISVINTESFTYDDTYQKLGDFTSEINVISVYKDNLIYACTDEGIAVQKEDATNLTSPDSWNSYFLQKDITASSVAKVGKYNNQIIAATNNGIYSFDASKWTKSWFSGINIIDFEVRGSIIYAISSKKLYQFDGTTLTGLFTDHSNNFKTLDVTENLDFLIGTSTGILDFENGKTSYIYPNGPASNLFTHLAVDKNGNLWSASGKNGAGVGVYQFDGNKWTNYNKANTNEMNSNDYYKIFSSASGNIYACTWGFGYTTFYSDGTNKTFDASNTDMVGISDNHDFLVISSVQEDAAGNRWVLIYWAANRKVLAKITPDDEWTFYDFDDPYFSTTDLTYNLVIDQYGTKWFSTTNGNLSYKGLFYFNENGVPGESGGNGYGLLTTADGLSSGNISALAVDQRGELWIGKIPGIDILAMPSHPTNSPIRQVNAFRNQNISCIAVDPINQKWIGTNEGVYLINSDGTEILNHYTSDNSPLPVDQVKSIAIDENSGIVYIGTDFGLSSIKTSSVKPQTSFNDIFVYPNPYKISTSEEKNLNIEGLIKQVEIKILSISGKLIRTLESGSAEAPGGNIAFWDGKDENGVLVSSGVYLIIAYDSDGSNIKTTKVAVIRK